MKYVELIEPTEAYPDIPLINLTTLECDEYCIAITQYGLCIVGHAHNHFTGLPSSTKCASQNSCIDLQQFSSTDNISEDQSDTELASPAPIRKPHARINHQVSLAADLQHSYYETIYSLLDTISPMYRQAFFSQLSSKLILLQQHQIDWRLEFILLFIMF